MARVRQSREPKWVLEMMREGQRISVTLILRRIRKEIFAQEHGAGGWHKPDGSSCYCVNRRFVNGLEYADLRAIPR